MAKIEFDYDFEKLEHFSSISRKNFLYPFLVSQCIPCVNRENISGIYHSLGKIEAKPCWHNPHLNEFLS